MRILWTSPHCRPDWLDRLGEESQGGQTVVMNRLPRALAQADPSLHVDIFTRLQDDDPYAAWPIKPLDREGRVRLIRLPCGPSDRYLPKEILYGEPIREFAAAIESFAAREGVRYDLLHGHYADGWETVRRLAGRWAHRPPVLLTTHSLGRRKQQDGLARGEGDAAELEARYNFRARIASEERSLAMADRILPLSTPEAHILFTSYDAVPPGDPRVLVFPNGINPGDFPPLPLDARSKLRRELGVAEEALLLLVPSRVDPRKGQENLVRALDAVAEDLQEASWNVLFVAWPAPPTPYALRLKRHIHDAGLDERILIHPPVPHERMGAFFAAADGVVLPSQEYFSIAMLEAMLLEKPLIASLHSSGVDVIVDGVNGLIADHNDPPALGQAVVRLLRMGPEARKGLGARARQRVLQGYTWDRLAERLLERYDEVLDGRG
jgi:glycosyltransferase involved in cell wall biosynthesis